MAKPQFLETRLKLVMQCKQHNYEQIMTSDIKPKILTDMKESNLSSKG